MQSGAPGMIHINITFRWAVARNEADLCVTLLVANEQKPAMLHMFGLNLKPHHLCQRIYTYINALVLSDLYISNTITGPFRAWPVFLSDCHFFKNPSRSAVRARFFDFNVDFFDFFGQPTPRFWSLVSTDLLRSVMVPLFSAVGVRILEGRSWPEFFQNYAFAKHL